MVCYGYDDLEYFFRSKREFPAVLLKRVHWDSRFIGTEQDLSDAERDAVFPAVAEFLL